jgi:hypothetical protein
MKSRASLFFGFVAALLGTRAASAASNEVLWVANNGVDGGGCGAQSAPCRSISQAITNAPSGASIRVGPGRYGDLNGDGAFQAGEEGPRPSGRRGLIEIDKSVRISSTHGAEVTTIDPGPVSPSAPRFTVVIRSSGVSLGDAGHGFDLIAAEAGGIEIQGPLPTLSGMRIVGNVVTGGLIGIKVRAAVDSLTIAENLILKTSSGLLVQLPEWNVPKGPVLIERNTVLGNLLGVWIQGTNARFVANVVDANRDMGAHLIGPRSVVEDNFFTAGQHWAVYVYPDAAPNVPAVARFTGNTVAGNGGGGVLVGPGASVGVLTGNNIYGNGYDTDGSAPANCGLLVDAPSKDVVAAGNYWGAATGAGPDPADAAGPSSGCDLEGAKTTVTPFAPAPFPTSVHGQD